MKTLKSAEDFPRSTSSQHISHTGGEGKCRSFAPNVSHQNQLPQDHQDLSVAPFKGKFSILFQLDQQNLVQWIIFFIISFTNPQKYMLYEYIQINFDSCRHHLKTTQNKNQNISITQKIPLCPILVIPHTTQRQPLSDFSYHRLPCHRLFLAFHKNSTIQHE